MLYNHRIKINPLTGLVLEDAVASRPIFGATPSIGGPTYTVDGARAKEDRRLWEAEEMSAALADRLEAETAANRARSAARARKAVYELCACNDLDAFVTLTLAPDKIDRYDYKAAVERLRQWLDNRVRRKGLRYVGVPELHKDGAVHFHALANSAALKLSASGHLTRRGQMIYNVTDWALGFTTCVLLDEHRDAAAHYIAKYVTKAAHGGGGTIGGRYYYHGGELSKAVCIYDTLAYDDERGKEIVVEDGRFKIKYRGV